MNEFKSIGPLGIKISTHLCRFCVHRDEACEEVKYLYGTGEDPVTETPNICACSGFEPSVVPSYRVSAQAEKEAFYSSELKSHPRSIDSGSNPPHSAEESKLRELKSLIDTDHIET